MGHSNFGYDEGAAGFDSESRSVGADEKNVEKLYVV
jgi:hypothetical protein